MAEPVARLEMRGVSKAFGATLALDGVDLRVNGGDVCALVGQNGAGKSTLMAILAGAMQPDAGAGGLRGGAAGRRVDGARRDAVRTARSAGGAPGRRGDDSPGALARAAPHGDGEHRPRRRADAWTVRHRRPDSHAANGRTGARRARPC